MTDKTDLSAAANPEAHAHAGDERERIKGVFSSQEVRKVGTGTTTRKTIQKAYWFVEENDDGSLMVQPLNANYIPSGPKRTVPLDEFLERFAPEPEFYMQTVFPKMREVNKTIARADRHRKRTSRLPQAWSRGSMWASCIKVMESRGNHVELARAAGL